MTEDTPDRRFCVAPMMDCTDRHERYFLRLISRRVLLYTEMVTSGAVLHGDLRHLLGHETFEDPVALQLGGSDPAEMAAAARIGEAHGYAEVNVNIGCPSDRVQSGRIGACLMASPELVAACVAAMASTVQIPITVKTRIGIDDQDTFSHLLAFVDSVASAGCRTFIVHARKAWLQGLSPKENREIPPIRYDVVYRLKQERPDLEVVVNGGITTLEAAHEHLGHVDGAMLGRAVYDNPYLLAGVDSILFSDRAPVPSRREILSAYAQYVSAQLDRGVRLHSMARHITGLFAGCPGARAWRRYLSEAARERQDANVLFEAAEQVSDPAPGMLERRGRAIGANVL